MSLDLLLFHVSLQVTLSGDFCVQHIITKFMCKLHCILITLKLISRVKQENRGQWDLQVLQASR